MIVVGSLLQKQGVDLQNVAQGLFGKQRYAKSFAGRVVDQPFTDKLVQAVSYRVMLTPKSSASRIASSFVPARKRPSSNASFNRLYVGSRT